MPYCTSSPARSSGSTLFTRAGICPAGQLVPLPSAYGRNNNERGGSIFPSPSRIPNRDTHPRASRGMSDQNDHSFFLWISLTKFIPQIRFPPSEKRSDWKGILNSALHPSRRSATSAYHIASQFISTSLPSSYMKKSRITPAAFTSKINAVFLSKSLSIPIDTLSEGTSLSRRDNRRTMPSGLAS